MGFIISASMMDRLLHLPASSRGVGCHIANRFGVDGTLVPRKIDHETQKDMEYELIS